MFNDLVVANKSITEMEVGVGERIDEIAINVLMQDCPDFALPIRKYEVDNIIKLRYELVGGIRLSYCPAQMKKMEFIKLLSGLLYPFKFCMDWFLDYHYIYLDKNYIFTSRDFSSVRYIYIPVDTHANSDADIKSFFSDIVLWAELVDDPGYTMNLLRLIRDPNSNLLSLMEYIQQGQADTAKMPEHSQKKEQKIKESVSFSNIQSKIEEELEKKSALIDEFFKEDIPTPKKKIADRKILDRKLTEKKTVEPIVAESVKKDEEFGMDSAMNNILAGLGGEVEEKKKEKKNRSPKEKKQGGLFGGILGGGKKVDNINPIDLLNKSTNVPNNDISNNHLQRTMPKEMMKTPKADYVPNMMQTDNNRMMDDCTVIEEEHMDDPNNLFLSLTEGAIGYECPQLIKLNFANGFVTIGRRDKNGMAQTTYGFDSSLSFISRMHFRIEKTSSGYSIIDTDSKGGTFLNGQRLMANIAYPMNVGDVITITSRHLSYRVSQ